MLPLNAKHAQFYGLKFHLINEINTHFRNKNLKLE